MLSVLKILRLLLGDGLNAVCFGNRLSLCCGRFVAISCLEVDTVFRARLPGCFGRRLRAAMTRERLARQNGSAVPSFGNGVASYLRDDDRLRGFGCGCGSDCRYRLLARLAVLRERLARQHDRFRRWAVRF